MPNRQLSMLNNCSYVKPLTTVCITVAQAMVASKRLNTESDSHANTCVVGDNCLVVHEHDKPVNVYSYDPKEGQKCVRTVNAAVCYNDPYMLDYGNAWVSMRVYVLRAHHEVQNGVENI